MIALTFLREDYGLVPLRIFQIINIKNLCINFQGTSNEATQLCHTAALVPAISCPVFDHTMDLEQQILFPKLPSSLSEYRPRNFATDICSKDVSILTD